MVLLIPMSTCAGSRVIINDVSIINVEQTLRRARVKDDTLSENSLLLYGYFRSRA